MAVYVLCARVAHFPLRNYLYDDGYVYLMSSERLRCALYVNMSCLLLRREGSCVERLSTFLSVSMNVDERTQLRAFQNQSV